MYRVTIERASSNTTKIERVDVIMKTEKLFEVIGRFNLIYGPPVITDNICNIKEFEFFKQIGNDGWLSAEIVCAKVAPDGTMIRKGKIMGEASNLASRNWNRKEVPVVRTPTEPPEPNEERIEALLKAGAIEVTYNSW